MSKEHLYYEEYPEIYEKFPEKRQSRARGANTLSENFKKLRAFFNWAQAEGLILVSPFSKFKCEKELYGTPYYLTKEEMQKMLNTDLSATPEYERQPCLCQVSHNRGGSQEEFGGYFGVV